MIEINLVPEQLRKKRKAGSSGGSAKGFSKEALLWINGVFLLILIAAALFLQLMLSSKISKREDLQKQLDGLTAAKTNVEKVKKDMDELKGRVKTLEDVVGQTRILIAEKLNSISDVLPRGVWLTRVALEGKYFVIEGSAVSKVNSAINDIHTLRANLKDDVNFMRNLKTLEVEMIKTRNVGTLPVADFTIRAEVNKDSGKEAAK